MDETPLPARFHRIDAAALRERLAGPRPPLLLDVRRGEAFREEPGLPGAVPFALDREPLRLPELARDHPIAAYCL
jgi:rhodanese-related sulfurtransferase